MDVVILKPSRSGSLLASISGEGVWVRAFTMHETALSGGRLCAGLY